MDYTKYVSKLHYIEKYKTACNASTASEVDSNANVEHKNVASLRGELFKKDEIGVHRLGLSQKIEETYNKEIAQKYIDDLDSHIIYRHDETSGYLLPYCVSITMYPFLFDGLTSLGGGSTAPKHLDSFCGEFINLVFAVSSQFAGAVATPEFLVYMDFFIRKEYGNDYYKHIGDIVDLSIRKRSIDSIITDKFQSVVHTLNTPASARNYQSVFWNIAYFDKNYFDGLFHDFVFPDGTAPTWDSVSWLQKRFMNWFNEERLIFPNLTFPVETMNLLSDGSDILDKEYKDFTAEMWAKGHSFFTYNSNSVDSLASCCRLRNEITENQFSYTLGAGGISTGSKAVITMNINRIVQNAVRDGKDISNTIREYTKDIHKYLTAYNEIVKENLNAHLLPVYEAGYISMEKQYLTIGINGFVEAAEFMGIDVGLNDEYMKFGEMILKPIYEENKKAKTNELMFNTEFIPAENLGVKNAMWDKKDGYVVNRDCYNSYFFVVESDKLNVIDKMILHGDRLTKYLDGGSACHINLDEHLTKDQYLKLIEVAVKTGCSYFTFNIPNTICNKCGYVSKHKLKSCPKCGSTNLDYLSRIIGYLKRISSWSSARQIEESKRYYDGESSSII